MLQMGIPVVSDCFSYRAAINFQNQEVQTSYHWNLEVPLKTFGSPNFLCDALAVWRIVKLSLKNKRIFQWFISVFLPYTAVLLFMAYSATEGMSGISWIVM